MSDVHVGRLTLGALLLVCAAWGGMRAFAPGSAFATDPGAATWIDQGTVLEQDCADRTDPNEVLVNFSPSNATLYIGASLTFVVDICLGADTSVGVALEDEDGAVDDRFDVATVDTTSVQTKRIEYYLHCHQQDTMPSDPNYLEGHQASSVENDNFLHVDIVGYDAGDIDDLEDNHGATLGPAHVRCLDLPSCNAVTPGPGVYCVGGETRLAAPLVSAIPSGSRGAPFVPLTLGGVLVALTLGGGAWWLRRAR